jgi:hypothetical protein
MAWKTALIKTHNFLFMCSIFNAVSNEIQGKAISGMHCIYGDISFVTIHWSRTCISSYVIPLHDVPFRLFKYKSMVKYFTAPLM